MSIDGATRPTDQDGEESVDLATWVRYFDELESAMHDFEVGLSQHDVAPLRPVVTPAGHPPEELRDRSNGLYTQITELEFRARVLREEVRAQVARLPRGGRNLTSDTKGDWDFGTSLDIRG